MSIDLDRLMTDGNFLDQLQNLERQVAELQGISMQAGELSEISDDLGAIRAGMFIAGEGDPMTGDLTGVAMIYPAQEVQIGDQTYYLSILGCQDGVVQFGLSAEDGQAIFAAGSAVIGENGITITGINMVYDQTATLEDGSGEKRLRMGIFEPTGRTDLLVGGFRWNGNFRKYFASGIPATTEHLGNNRGFELGDFTDWTKVEQTSGGSQSIISIYTADYYEGLKSCNIYLDRSGSGDLSIAGSITSAAVNVTEGVSYTVKCHVKLRTSTTYHMSSTSRTYYTDIMFYDGSGSLISSTRLASTWPISSWREDSVTVLAPTGAITAKIKSYFKIQGTSDNSKDSPYYYRVNILADSYSLTSEDSSGGGGTWEESPQEVRLYLDHEPVFEDTDGNILKMPGVESKLLKPNSALTAADSGSAGNVDVGAHYYKVTFCDEYGETPGGTAASVTLAAAHKVNLTYIPLGKWGTVTRKIYRTKAGETTPYYLLTEVMDNTTTSYQDDTADADLTDELTGNNTTGSRPTLPGRIFIPWLYPGGVTTAIQYNTSQIMSFFTQQSSAANGDEIWLSIYLDAGTYTMYMWGQKTSNKGKCDWYMDDVLITSTPQDWYASTATYNVVMQVNNVIVGTPGYHILKLKVNGKNASSSSYLIGLTFVELVLNTE